jgi:soluble lytic murein transglycosylase-like protein
MNIRLKLNLIIFLVLLVAGGFAFYKFFPEIWGDVVYPLEYRDEIIKASNDFGVPRNLIAAVIFTESHFNPNAGSGAGANGLMQLVPGTARGVARQIGMTDYNDSKIFDPATNIRLGTAYLKSSIDSRGGNIDVALANYNAGPKYSGLFQVSLDRSVLPRETQGYLRKVNGTWEAYDKIYGENWEGPTKPFDAPSESSFVSQVNIKNLITVLFGN